MNTPTKLLALAVLVFLVLGCLNLDEVRQEWSCTTKEPKKIDLVGTWIPTSETIDDMKKFGKYSISRHEIVLREDGTFSIINMPDWWSNPYGESSKGFDSLEGKWKIYKDDIGWPTTYAIQCDLEKSWFTIKLQRNRPPYRMFLGVGDPDEGHYMIFIRNNGT